ncbi:MAG TPA: DUF4097 family beta strand repeat-containing protein [Cellulomonas sp.]
MSTAEARVSAFAVPGPVVAVVDLAVGDLRVVASDRSDAVVEVRPGDPDKPHEVAAADHTQVDLVDGVLTVRAPGKWKQYTPWGGNESVHVTLLLPTGSRLRATTIMSALQVEGWLGECRFRTSMGAVRIQDAGTVDVRTGAGDVTVGAVTGIATVSTGTGVVQIDAVGPGSSAHSGNGDVVVGDAADGLKVTSSNGALVVDRARGDLTARTSNGRISLGDVARGTVSARTAAGAVDIAVHDGVAAELDVHTYGAARSTLQPIPAPAAVDDAVRVVARSQFGDVVIRRVSDSR